MTSGLSITADWETLDEGSPEERACFAALGILYNDVWLTEGHDTVVKRMRGAPFLSAYHFAEWVAWNWWRLRWEPRSRAPDWGFAHRLSTIESGYVWPNITIFSDGERTALVAKPTQERAPTPFRYISNYAAAIPSRQFENAVDRFMEQVQGQLRAETVPGTNFDRIWREVSEERRNPDLGLHRKIEALLGADPGEVDEGIVQRPISGAYSRLSNIANVPCQTKPDLNCMLQKVMGDYTPCRRYADVLPDGLYRPARARRRALP